MLGARFGMGALGVRLRDAGGGRRARHALLRAWSAACRRRSALAMNPALATGANMMMGKTDEEAMTRGLRGAQYFGFSLGYTNGAVRLRQGTTLNRTFAEVASRANEGNAPRIAEPEDETQRTLFRAGGRGLLHRRPRAMCARTCACYEDVARRPDELASCSAASASTSTSWSRWSCSQRGHARIPGAPRASTRNGASSSSTASSTR